MAQVAQAWESTIAEFRQEPATTPTPVFQDLRMTCSCVLTWPAVTPIVAGPRYRVGLSFGFIQ
jgi:hypothetical protein